MKSHSCLQEKSPEMADKEYDSAIPFQLQLRIVSTAVDEEDEARPAVKPVRLSCFDGWRQRIGKCDVGKAAAGLRQRVDRRQITNCNR